MESRYYLFTDQTLENTKVSDRAHALHITKSRWDSVQKHLDRKKDIQMMLDKEERKKRNIYEGNKAMTDTWENSLEKLREKKDASRAMTSEEIQAEKVKKFFVMRAEQEKLREELVRNIKKKMFRSSGTCDYLNSAFKTSEALFEMDRQVEFKECLKKHEEEDKKAFAQKLMEDTLRDAEEKKQKNQQELEKRKNYGALLKQVIEENADRKKALKEIQFRKETKDNIAAMEEMRLIAQDELESKLARKRETVAEISNFMKNKIAFEKQLKQEEKELEEVIEVYRESKHKMDCMKKEKEKEVRGRLVKRNDLIAEKVFGMMEDNTAEEEERVLRNGIAEKDAVEAANAKAKADFAEMWKNNRIEEYQKFQERKEAQRKKKEEIMKWEKLNQFKNIEESKQYEIQKRKEAWDQILKYRKTLLDQMDENQEERKRLESLMCEPDFTKEIDDAFFKYANEILEEAKKKGRNTFPIEKAVMVYKKANLLPLNVDCKKDDEKADSPKELKNKKSCRCFRKK